MANLYWSPFLEQDFFFILKEIQKILSTTWNQEQLWIVLSNISYENISIFSLSFLQVRIFFGTKLILLLNLTIYAQYTNHFWLKVNIKLMKSSIKCFYNKQNIFKIYFHLKLKEKNFKSDRMIKPKVMWRKGFFTKPSYFIPLNKVYTKSKLADVQYFGL